MIHVLLADGHKLAREALEYTLSAIEGIAVVGSVDEGSQAADFCRQHQVDVVIITAVIPTLESLAIAKSIREAAPGVGIILVTNYPGVSQKMLEEAGIDDCLTKHSGLKELLAKIQLLAKGSRQEPL